MIIPPNVARVDLDLLGIKKYKPCHIKMKFGNLFEYSSVTYQKKKITYTISKLIKGFPDWIPNDGVPFYATFSEEEGSIQLWDKDSESEKRPLTW